MGEKIEIMSLIGLTEKIRELEQELSELKKQTNSNMHELWKTISTSHTVECY
jgi:hypothetical protein